MTDLDSPEKNPDWNRKINLWKQKRLLIWFCIAAAFLTGYFHRTVIGVVADNLMRDFAIERAADLGILASVYFWTYAALQLPSGIFADRFGPRIVISVALVISAAGSFVFSLAETLPQLVLGRFITTAGIGVVFVSLIKIQSTWFRAREFATMSGLITLFGNSGSLLSATPMAFVVETWGWRAAFSIIATYSLCMGLLCWQIVRNKPEDIGLPGIAKIESTAGIKPPDWETPPLCIRECVKTVITNPRTWPPLIASTSLFGVYMTLVGVWWIPYLMQVHHLPRVEASQFILVMVTGNMISAPMVGYISDRLACRRWPYLASTSLLALSMLVLVTWNNACPPLWAIYPIAFFFGIGISGLTLTIACVKDVNPPYVTGIAAGITNSGPFIGAALMQPIFGWVLDQYWQGISENGIKIYPQHAYENAFWLCFAVLVFGLVAAFFIKESRNDAS